jgi:hypothetical protein
MMIILMLKFSVLQNKNKKIRHKKQIDNGVRRAVVHVSRNKNLQKRIQFAPHLNSF